MNLLFALFALAYGGTLINGIRFHNAISIESFVSINRQDTIFVILVYCALIWYVAEYTKVKSRLFLWGLTAVFLLAGAANIFRANLIYDQILSLGSITLSWGEELAFVEATDSIWSILFLAGQLAVLAYILFACIRQFTRGERRQALILSIGVFWFVAALGAELLGESGAVPLLFYGEFGFLGFVLAMSLQMSNEIIDAEEQLADYRMNLEELVKQRTAELEETQARLIQQTQEQATIEERSRLARDLHDAVTQTIYSAALIVEALPVVWERNPDEGRRNLVKLRQLVRGALAEMRTLLFELRPDSLEAAELETLVHQQCDAFTGRTRIPVEIRADATGQPPGHVKTTVYRITQETLNNIAKHAQADRVKITLIQKPQQVSLNIWDNGRGFNPASGSTGQMGIRFMKERAATIGASIKITSKIGEGSTVILDWPDEDPFGSDHTMNVADEFPNRESVDE